jgi:hypothetical protein
MKFAAFTLIFATSGCPAVSKRSSAPQPSSWGLDVGGEYQTYRKLTPEPFLSTVHGDRWVNVYVSANAAEAYLNGGEIPVNGVIVKDSFENVGGKPGAPGPFFVMQKRAPGYAPEHGDWYYGFYWPSPTGKFAGKPMAAQGKAPGVTYCIECHDSYDRGLGGLVPTSQLMR